MFRLSYIRRGIRSVQPRIFYHGNSYIILSVRLYNSVGKGNQQFQNAQGNSQQERDPLNIDELFPDSHGKSSETDNIERNKEKGNEQVELSASQNQPLEENHESKSFERDSLLSDIDTYVEDSKDSRNKSIDISTEGESEFDILNDFLNDHDKKQNDIVDTKKDKDDFNDLLSSLNLDDGNTNGDEGSFDFDKLSEMTRDHLSSKNNKTQAEEFNPIDVDKNDENIFDLSFLDMDKTNDNEKKVIEEEKQLFQNIFNSYVKPTDQDEQSELLQNLRDSVNISKNQIDDILSSSTSTRYKLTNVSGRLKDELFTKTKDALEPTIKYIHTSPALGSSTLLTQYLRTVFTSWFEIIKKAQNDKAVFEDVYLNKLLKKSTKFSEKHDKFVNSVYVQSMEHPSNPILNVFTLPIIFNSILNTIAMKHHDGQLALSLFNFLKKDINLYTVCCNQQTYNEILRIQWLFYGKSNLYGIEIIFIEMLNNGFSGDLMTFNILKQIIIDYHSLKMGQASLNEAKLPIWSKEDDKRVENLERKLNTLANVLRRSDK
ncbi:unnamed protein product [Debaryomyces tyrocola]|nr:unnamed protein product [Debaryomyces tyrocola]